VEAEPLYERVLVMRSQLGDERAFAELVALYAPRLRYFVHKFVGADANTDDLVQEIWLAVFRGLPRLGAVEAFRTWLYRIARDQALAVLRRRRRAPPMLTNGEATAELAEDTDDFTPEEIAAVHRALDALPTQQREALVLRFLEDMSYEEIARVTDTAVGTVRSRLFYGKQALRAQLRGDD
jgi:RNA polymerase sigma-70 factor, ECF subfamily